MTQELEEKTDRKGKKKENLKLAGYSITLMIGLLLFMFLLFKALPVWMEDMIDFFFK